jgi:lipoprotein-releasing system permease protein
MSEPTDVDPAAALRPRRQERFIFLVAGFSSLSITLGVATLIIVIALMNGFRQELLSKNLALSGHLLIRPAQYPLKDWQAVADRIGQVDGVRFAAPIVDSGALASSPCRTQSFIRSCGARRATPTAEACRHRRQQNAAG